MIDIGLVCQEQRKKIFVYASISILALLGVGAVNGTLVAKNAYQKSQIEEKRLSIAGNSAKISRMKKITSFVEKEKFTGNLPRKSGFYSPFNKTDFINSLITKMNNDDNVDVIDAMKANATDTEYSGFFIRLETTTDKYLSNILQKFRTKVEVDNSLNFQLEANILRIDFNADYEYVAYKVLAMMQKLLPGYVVVNSFAIKPVNEDVKTKLYNHKFYHKDIAETELDDRLSCSVALSWVYLTASKPTNVNEYKVI